MLFSKGILAPGIQQQLNELHFVLFITQWLQMYALISWLVPGLFLVSSVYSNCL